MQQIKNIARLDAINERILCVVLYTFRDHIHFQTMLFGKDMHAYLRNFKWLSGRCEGGVLTLGPL